MYRSSSRTDGTNKCLVIRGETLVMNVSKNLMLNMIITLIQLVAKICNATSKRFWHWYLRVYCSFHGVRLQKKCPPHFWGRAYLNIEKGARMSIGEDFICRSNPLYSIDCGLASKIFVKKEAELIIGDFSGISNTIIHCHNSIRIGNHVNIGAGTLIMDSNFHSTDWRQRLERKTDVQNAQTKPVSIGDNVFIGARCIICKGTVIGDNSMICAGSTVIGNIPPNELWGGSPAKFIKKLPD